MASVNRWLMAERELDTIQIFSDFTEDQADTVFIDTITDSGTVAIGDALGGIAVLTPSDGSVGDNDEAYYACPNEVFKLTATKPIYGKARIQFTEANTDDANVAFGFQNAVGANSILDNGAGLKVSGDTFAIYKVDGGTVWKCVSVVNGGTANVSTSVTTAGGASYQVLEVIQNDDGRSATATFVFKCDGLYLRDSNNAIITHSVPYASATETQVFVGVKNGDTNLETLNADYVIAKQKR
jgi:hypothetical protein